MENSRKRIGIDARFYGPKQKGLGRYTQEIVDRILLLDKENDYVVFLSPDNFDDLKIINPNVKKVLAEARWYTLAEQINLPILIAKEKLNLIHFPHFNVPLFCRTRFIVTIHDLILTKFPTVKASTLNPFLYWFKNFAYRVVIKNAVKRAEKIIAVSQFTKDDIINKFKIPSDKVIVTHLGVADMSTKTEKDGSALFDKYKIDKPFLLYVGNAYPHKNLEGLIKIFPKIRESEKKLKLVLIGKDDYFYGKVKDFAKKYDENNIIFPGFVPEKYLPLFYQNASLYVFPSYYEGFGLPPLEAMAKGCPVASSNQASMPEVLGDSAVYFNPYNENDMIKAIANLIKDSILREEIVRRGREQVKKYCWEECGKKTVSIYKDSLK